MERNEDQLTPNSSEQVPYSSGGAGGESCPKYKGVRKRKWGKWVSEVRLPNSRERIWLGSYDTAEKAARAFDAAQFCLRGSHAHFNFPDSPPNIPAGRSFSPQEIQEVAARFAEQDEQQDQQHDDSNDMVNVITDQSFCSREPSPNFPPVELSDQPCDHQMMIANGVNTDWSFFNFLDHSTTYEIGASTGYDSFDHYPSFLGQLDKMQSDEFCIDPTLQAAAPDQDIYENVVNGDELVFSQHSSSFLWNF